MTHLISLVISVFLVASPARSAVFGGREFIPVTEQTKQSRAIAVAVLSNSWKTTAEPDFIALDTEPLGKVLCASEPMAKENSLSYACTGFLVGPDLLVTAGHCATNPGETREETGMYCEAFGWLFDYRADANGKFQTARVPAENFFKCKRIIHAVREERAPFRDFALIQLDRKVVGREPLRMRQGFLPAGTTLNTLGHPLGTPLKASIGGKILLDNHARESFIAALTALEGNSGSPVMNEAGEVVGILTGGTPSMGLIEGGAPKACYALNRCDAQAENCRATDKDTSVFPGFQRHGSEIQRIGPIVSIVRTILESESRLTLVRDRERGPRFDDGFKGDERQAPGAGDELRDQLQRQARQGHRPVGYGQARKELFGKMALKSTPEGYAIRDVYCDRDYTARDFPGGQGPGPGKVPLAEVMNAEHTWPQSKFGGQEKDAQKCDLHHLFPSDSQMNAIRGNHAFGTPVSGFKATKCPVSQFGRNAEGGWVFAPPTKQRGDTARAIFYFSVRYGLAVDATQEAELKRWHQEDPVSQEEIVRNGEVEKIQGNRNPFVDHPEYVQKISNF